MIPEIGQFALILALCVTVVQTVLPIGGLMLNKRGWSAVARPAAQAQFLFVVVAYICLTWAFISHDFSVKYVVSNSNLALPLIYRISGVWGAHEGSLLLWMLMLSGWTGAVTIFNRGVPADVVARVISVMGLISIGFLLFMLLTSNPFERFIPAAADGRDLNPLLQDPGLAIHPPMLYMGYVGFAVAFAFAIAALAGGRLDAAWARWARPWTNVAWCFLTLGIMLGSWWAYNELGWGGWWFWDPVENASFMPWLAGTALIHSLAVTEKRGLFKPWTVLLAMTAFSLSLLGTFLVRSGVLTSVHAFATDPERGVFILMFLALVIGGSLILYAIRAPSLVGVGHYSKVSREGGILTNNIILVVATATVLLGTLYPLLVDALGWGKVSVGPPYFDLVFAPVMIPLVILMGFGGLARWKNDSFGKLFKRLWLAATLAAVAAVALPFLIVERWSFGGAVASALGVWTIASALRILYERTKGARQPLTRLRTTPLAIWGMVVAHAGIGVFVLGVGFTMAYSLERDVALAPGESETFGDYEFRFDGVGRGRGPNFEYESGTVTVFEKGEMLTTLKPEKRVYLVNKSPMTEAAIDIGVSRDLFVSLGEAVDDNGGFSLRIQIKPMIRWIWGGAVLMALGGFLAAADKRYRRRREVAATSAADQSEASHA